MTIAIRDVRGQHTQQKRSKIRWRCQSLRINRAVSHGLHNGGEKVGQGGKGEVAAEMNDSVRVAFVVRETGHDLLPLDLLLGRRVVELEALYGESSVFF